jgi:hypothetical protein
MRKEAVIMRLLQSLMMILAVEEPWLEYLKAHPRSAFYLFALVVSAILSWPTYKLATALRKIQWLNKDIGWPGFRWAAWLTLLLLLGVPCAFWLVDPPSFLADYQGPFQVICAVGLAASMIVAIVFIAIVYLWVQDRLGK